MVEKTKIAVLVSGGGTNLQALIDAQREGEIKSGEIVLVISSKPDVYALTRAADAGIPAAVADRKLLGSHGREVDIIVFVDDPVCPLPLIMVILLMHMCKSGIDGCNIRHCS